MSEAEFVEAFWWLAILVGFVGFLAVGGLMFEAGSAARDTFKRVRAFERARVRWAEILRPGLKDWDSLFASVRRREQ